MQRIRIIGVIAVLALVAAACSGGDDETAAVARPRRPAARETGALSEYGESTDADPALVEKALGPVEPSDEASWNIILASIARADAGPRSSHDRQGDGVLEQRRSVTPGPAATSSWATPTAAATPSTSGVR